MNTNELRQSVINVMTEDIIDEKPKMVIRRSQNDNIFVIYIKVKYKDEFGESHTNIIPIDTITEKSNPRVFSTIKKIIKNLNNGEKIKIQESKYFLSLLHPVEIKDEKNNAVEYLIEYDHNTLSAIGDTPVPDNINPDDKFTIEQMLIIYVFFKSVYSTSLIQKGEI